MSCGSEMYKDLLQKELFVFYDCKEARWTYSASVKNISKVGTEDKLADTPRITKANTINHSSLKYKGRHEPCSTF